MPPFFFLKIDVDKDLLKRSGGRSTLALDQEALQAETKHDELPSEYEFSDLKNGTDHCRGNADVGLK